MARGSGSKTHGRGGAKGSGRGWTPGRGRTPGSAGGWGSAGSSRNFSTGRGRGGGRGDRGAAAERSGSGKSNAAATADEDNTRVGRPQVTKELVESLRPFSTPKWWLISESAAKEASVRKHVKPDEFQRQCLEKHAGLKQAYEAVMEQDSEQRWLRKVSSQGTAGDKVASLTMLIQVCPVFSTSQIKALLSMAGRLGRSDCVMAVDALKELFVNTLLPDRKLRTLSQMPPVAPKSMSKEAFVEHCVTAFFEDYVKTAYAAFIQVLSEMAHNSVAFFKSKAIKTAGELLAAKPEQDSALLALIINKFGDSVAKVASNAAFQLKSALESQPDRKLHMIKEVEVFLTRANISSRSKYHAVLFLTEMKLRRGESAVAVQLLRLYVARLEDLLKEKTLYRKAKFGPQKAHKFRGRYRGKRGGKLNLSRGKAQGVPRVKRKTLGEDENGMVRTVVTGIQRALPFLQMDVSTISLEETTVNALFKVCHIISSFPTRIAILSLLFNCLSAAGSLPDRFYRLLHEQAGEFDLFGSSYRHKALVLLLQSVPKDVSVARGTAMCRRVLQVGANAEPAVGVAALLLLRDLLSARQAEVKPLLNSLDSQLLDKAAFDDDDEEERFVDDKSGDEHFVDNDKTVVGGSSGSRPKRDSAEKPRYNPLAREPRFAKARHTPLWELYALTAHVHPFVADGAAKLLNAEPLANVEGDPFEVFSSAELLEQFNNTTRTPRGKDGAKSQPRVPFTSEHFSKKKTVLPHQKFFHQYFTDAVVQRVQQKKARRKGKTEEDVDEERVVDKPAQESDGDNEEEADAFFDEHLRGQVPRDDDDDDDPDEDDLDEDDLGEDDEDEDAGEDEEGAEPDPGGWSEDHGGGEDEDEQGRPARGRRKGKRRAEGEAEEDPRSKKFKGLLEEHGGSTFASVDDFEEFLGDDG